MAKIQLNGRKLILKNKCSIFSLLKKYGIDGSKIAVELNTKIINRNKYHGLIINAAGYTHTSVAIRDALAILSIPIVELHITNIYNREKFRHKSLISKVAKSIICGFGVRGYVLALEGLKEIIKNENR